MKFRYVLPATLALCALATAGGGIVSGQYWLDLSTGWEFTAGQDANGSMENPAEEKNLILNYDFENGGGSVFSSRDLGDIEAIESLLLIQLLVKGPGGNLAVAVEDAQNQLFIYRLGRLESDEQKMLEVQLESPSEVAGKAGDKKIHYPVKSIRVMVEKDDLLLKGKITVERFSFHSAQFQKAN